jgi:hypothetical protein
MKRSCQIVIITMKNGQRNREWKLLFYEVQVGQVSKITSESKTSVSYTCDPSSFGNIDQDNCSSKPTQAKTETLFQKYPTQKRLMCLKW